MNLRNTIRDIEEYAMKSVVIIPCRYGSTRFEGKPLALICGKPMVQHVYEAASRADYVDRVVVATDDQRILSAVTRFGGQGVMTSAEQRSGTDRAAEAAGKIGLSPEDIIINVQGDQPLVDPRCLNAVAEPLVADEGLEMSTLAYRIVDPQEYTNPKDVKVVMDDKGRALYFSRACIPYARDEGEKFDTYKHLGIYAYRRRFLDFFSQWPTGYLERVEKLEQLRALEHGACIKVVVTPYDSPEVDLPSDVLRIEKLMRAH
jgi:3-deoxy-manno-octulosonate cytidylyltransferase (CMP-KDO synthetase)